VRGMSHGLARWSGAALLVGLACAPHSLWGTEGAPVAPLLTHRFLVAFDGVPEIAAAAVRGLESESLVSAESGPAALPENAVLKPVHLVIARPLQPPDALWDWRLAVLEGKNDLRNGRIAVLGPEGSAAVSFYIRSAWPFKWVWPDLDANDPRPAVEEIHFLALAVGTTPPSGKSGKEPQPPIVKDPFRDLDEQLKKKGTSGDK